MATSGRGLAGLRSVRPVVGRWPAALVALLGVVLAVPSLVGPSWLQTVSDRQRGELLSQQWQWSWGRVDLTGLTGVELDRVPNPVGLAVAVVLLVLAAVAVAVWALARGVVVVLAPIALALLTGRLLTTAAERHGRSFREELASEAGLSISTGSTTAGWLETASAVVLLVALALMVVGSVRGVPRPEPAEPTRRDAADAATRHTGAASSAGLRPKGARLDGPEVGLTDEGGR
jgi:hypothetical protein